MTKMLICVRQICPPLASTILAPGSHALATKYMTARRIAVAMHVGCTMQLWLCASSTQPLMPMKQEELA